VSDARWPRSFEMHRLRDAPQDEESRVVCFVLSGKFSQRLAQSAES
jgi:hypothetical protein